eukprot:TRINITY_DN6920_c0_g1_i1.p1 TRINITY_DN6920_c0_g1~~TRINITY_DN6920_c0_g1_i1.p1  ORF type:complete len:545 (-),score=120.54 TRINITY_DN6920_c0_g1_i1:16-1629(-)
MEKFGFKKPINTESEVSISDRLVISSRINAKPAILYSKCKIQYNSKDAYFELQVLLPGEIAIGFALAAKKEMKRREYGSAAFNQNSFYYKSKDGAIIGNFSKRISADWYSSTYNAIGDTIGCATSKNGEFIFVSREGIKSTFRPRRTLTGVTLVPFIVVGEGAAVAVNVGQTTFKHNGFGLEHPTRLLTRSRDSHTGPSSVVTPGGVVARGTHVTCVVEQNQSRTCYANRPLVFNDAQHVPYFEVKFTHVEGLVAVGLMPQDNQTVQIPSSVGLANNGNCYVHSKYARWIASYQANDVIGCGLALNSFNQLSAFFTKNGQFLEFAPGTVYRPRDIVPGVRLSGQCSTTMNFDREDFVWDINQWPVFDQVNYFSALPIEIQSRILMFSAETKSFACLGLAVVCKEFSELAHMNVVWKRLYLRTFPFQNKKLRVRNWYKFFKRRFVHERYWGKTTFESLSIENCNKSDDKCPITWRELQLTTQSDIRVCNACKTRRLVYLVQEPNALKEHYEKGHLVVYNNTQPKLEEVYNCNVPNKLH